jgi:hypothetical protein
MSNQPTQMQLDTASVIMSTQATAPVWNVQNINDIVVPKNTTHWRKGYTEKPYPTLNAVYGAQSQPGAPRPMNTTAMLRNQNLDNSNKPPNWNINNIRH